MCTLALLWPLLFNELSLTGGTAVRPEKLWESEKQTRPPFSALPHTDEPQTHTHTTDALRDTMGCLPTSPITGLFIRVFYRQY